MGDKIRILLLDDHSLFREGLSRLLEAEPGFQIAGVCATVSEGLAALALQPVDLVLLDYDLGEEEGDAFLEGAKARGFAGRVLMVTAGINDSSAWRALESGVSGIFLKHNPPGQLIEAIRKVMKGEIWLDAKTIRPLIAAAQGKTEPQRGSQLLSSRERAVLKGVFEGLTNSEIAAQLQVSESSVKKLMQQLFDKTGVRTRSQLVRIALERYAHD